MIACPHDDYDIAFRCVKIDYRDQDGSYQNASDWIRAKLASHFENDIEKARQAQKIAKEWKSSATENALKGHPEPDKPEQVLEWAEFVKASDEVREALGHLGYEVAEIERIEFPEPAEVADFIKRVGILEMNLNRDLDRER